MEALVPRFERDLQVVHLMNNDDHEDLEYARWLVDRGYVPDVDVFKVLKVLKERRQRRQQNNEEPNG